MKEDAEAFLTHPSRARAIRALRDMAFPAITLSLAFGTLLGLFSLLNSVVLQPLPVPDQGRIVSIGVEVMQQDGHYEPRDPSPTELKDVPDYPWLEAGPVQQGIRHLRVEADGLSRSALVAYASSNVFTAMGVFPAEGRIFAPADPAPGALLSWSAKARYGKDLKIGSTLRVDGVALTLLGVLPKGFNGFIHGYEPEVWVPLEARALSGDREAKAILGRDIGIPTFGRLRPGSSVVQAKASLAPLAKTWQERSQDPWAVRRPMVKPLEDLRLERWKQMLPAGGALWVAAGLLILMATLNLGNLQVAAWMRDRDAWATRVALGASPARIVWEMGAPLLRPLAAGAAGAVPVAWIIGGLISRFQPQSEVPMAEVVPGMDWRTYFVAVALVALMALPLLGMAWAWCLRHTCRPESRGAVGGMRWRKTLLGTQISLSVILLCGTLGSLQDLWKAHHTPLGMNVRGVHAFSFGFPSHILGGRNEIRGLWTTISNRISNSGDIESSSVLIPPYEGFDPIVKPYRTPGGAVADCLVATVHEGTFHLLGIPLLMGRDFSVSDAPDGNPVAIVSALAAHQFWPAGSPLGQMVEDDRGRRATVVGVVADHLWEGPANKHRPIVFINGRQRFGPLQTLLVRSRIPETKLYEWIEREVGAIDHRLAIQRSEPLSSRLDRQLQPQRLAATIFGMMGATALVLSMLGLFALQRHLTVQRLPEAGLRMALGATPAQVRRDFLVGLAWPMGLGLLVGTLGTTLGGRLMASMIVGLPPLRLSTVLGVILGLVAFGLASAILPMLRLDKDSPSDLLRTRD